MSSCEFRMLEQRWLQEVPPAVMRRGIYPQGGTQYDRRRRAVFVKQARQEEYPNTIDPWLLICQMRDNRGELLHVLVEQSQV